MNGTKERKSFAMRTRRRSEWRGCDSSSSTLPVARGAITKPGDVIATGRAAQRNAFLSIATSSRHLRPYRCDIIKTGGELSESEQAPWKSGAFFVIQSQPDATRCSERAPAATRQRLSHSLKEGIADPLPPFMHSVCQWA